ncbi:restriction endonuclease subunit S [Dietzia cinnamea]|nr:restriction endonuclease subunit S [Dietzia cinnamea]
MNWAPYARYRAVDTTWLGQVPDHWETRNPKSLFRLRREPAHADDRQLTASQSDGVVYQDEYMENRGTRVVQVIEGQAGLKHVAAGDFVISLRSFQGGIEYSAAAGKISPAYTILQPLFEADHRYFAHLLKSDGFIQELRSTSNQLRDGQSLGIEHFAQVRVPLPPKSEQRAIGGFLDRETAKIDALIDKQEQLIATLREDRAATIHNAVTTNHVDPSSQALQLKRISRILDCKHLTAEFTDDGIPLASIREVQGRYVNLDSAKRTTEHFFHLLTSGDRRPQQGDLIFSRNATVGQVAEVQNTHEPFAMGQDVCLIRPNRSLVRAGFLWYSLRSDSVLRQLELMMIGSTFKRINVEEVKNIIIDVPSLKEQDSARRFLDERVSKIDALIDKSTGMIETLREYRSALITNAVTGKIDVREAV